MSVPAASPLFALRDLASAVNAVDLDGDAIDPAVATLRDLLDAAIRLLGEIQRPREPDDLEFDLDAIEPDAWSGGTRRAGSSHVADMCFAGTLELRRVIRELGAAQTTNDRCVAAETARRKLRRAIRAVLEAEREAGGHDVLGGPHQIHHQVSDLASGLAVRRLYAAFRRALRRAEASTAEAVLVAIRYAGGALATLVTAPDYADVRASDRAVLRDLRERALAWARHDRAVASGEQLLADLWTCADLLRGINRRQELRAHDAAVLERAAAGPGDDVWGWLALLEPLTGLDDSLDELVGRVRSRPDAPAIAALLHRIDEVR